MVLIPIMQIQLDPKQMFSISASSKYTQQF